MRAYTYDLRQKIVDAVDNKLGTNKEIAEMFGVHESYLYKLLRQRRETGDLSPLPHGGGATLKLAETGLRVLEKLIQTQSDASLEELRQQLKKKTKLEVSVATVWRGVEKLKLTVKKRRALPKRPIRLNVPPIGKNSRG